MSGWLKSIIGSPRPSGPPETLRRFATGEPTLSKDSITVEGEGWLVEVGEPETVRLFEVAHPGVDGCNLAYRAKLKTEKLDGRAYLEMWCRLPGRGEFFSKGLNQTVTGTTDWASFEIPFFLKKGQQPDLIKLNLAVEGRGKVWLKDVVLLKTPL